MSDYSAVEIALSQGADPAMLCATCPWDRTCLTPPSMTKSEIDQKIDEFSRKDDEEMAKARAEGGQQSMPVATLLGALMFGGKDTAAQICPVFALRLRSSGGRQIADGLKASMQKWDDGS
jgi:hypothetical protein